MFPVTVRGTEEIKGTDILSCEKRNVLPHNHTRVYSFFINLDHKRKELENKIETNCTRIVSVLCLMVNG